jgi:predicted Zn-dependent protease
MVAEPSKRQFRYGQKTSRMLVCAVILVNLHSWISYAYASEPHPERPFYNHLSAEDESRFGSALSNKIDQEGVPVPSPDATQQMLKVVRSSALETYLETIAAKLAQASQRPEIHYSVRVLDAPGVVNAFSIPGGHIYVTSGLLDFVQNESELAAILGHEIGHVVAGHTSNRIARVSLFGTVLDQIRQIGLIPDDASAQKLSEIAYPLLFAADARTFYSREDEIEADLLGLYEMARAGWDPGGEVSLLDRLAKSSEKQAGLDALIATHPDPSYRFLIVQNECRVAAFSSGLRRNSADFVIMQRSLHKSTNDPTLSSQLLFPIAAVIGVAVTLLCVGRYRSRRV